MSLYYVQKLIYQLNRDPNVRKRFESDFDNLLEEYDLTDEEIRALKEPDIGLLYQRDTRLARWLGDLLDAEGELVVGDNEPYAVSDTTDYTIPVHGERRGLPHVMLEIRQDLIDDTHGQQAWADRLSELLQHILDRLVDAGELRRAVP